MICISICETSVKKILASFKKAEMFEIRLDMMNLTPEEIQTVFSQPVKLIATCRQGNFSDDERKQKLILAIQSGAAYVDIEVETDNDFKKSIMYTAKKHNCKVIISYHNYKSTPSVPVLKNIIENCFSSGADIAKIACLAENKQDAAKILSLYASQKNLVSIGMGQAGKITRLASLLLGAPFTFASLEEGKETAPGQITLKQIKTILDILK